MHTTAHTSAQPQVLAEICTHHYTHIYTDILDRIDTDVVMELLALETAECDDKWVATVNLLVGAAFTSGGRCDKHSGHCQWPAVDLQVEGSPCVDWSSIGKGQGRQGSNAKALLSALLTVARFQPRVYIHENVPNFDVSIIEAVLGQVYHVTPIRVSPADVGHLECARTRVYTVCVHKTRCNTLAPISATYDELLRPLRIGSVVRVEDAFRETNHARLLEEMRWVEHRLEEGVKCEDIMHDWTPLLTSYEKTNLAQYESLWEAKHHMPANTDPAAAFTLMQDALTHPTMVNKEACAGASTNLCMWDPQH